MVDLPVLFATPDSQGIGLKPGSLYNLSIGGCAVESLTPVTVGDGLALFIRLPDERSAIKVDHALVRWAARGEFGVQFQSLRPEEQERLHFFLYEKPA
jgi:hypothetical protein